MNLLHQFVQSPTAQRIGMALLHSLWIDLAIAVVLALALLLLRRRPAATRYLACCIAMLLAILLPVLPLLVDRPAPPPASAKAASATTVASAATPQPLPQVPAPPQPPQPSQLKAQISREAVAVAPAPAGSKPISAAPAQAKPKAPLLAKLKPHIPKLAAFWMIGVGLLSLWHLGGWVRVQRLKRAGAAIVEPRWQETLSRLKQRLNIRGHVRLLESAILKTPAAIGWLKPAILLPLGAASGLSPQQLEAVLAHELAHIRRFDYLVNLFETAIETLLFYHPAVWWISRQCREERENCCDDLAVRCCGNALSYARALATLEELRAVAPALALAASGGTLLRRIRRIVGLPDKERRSGFWFGSGLASLILLAMVMLLARPASRSSAAMAQPTTQPTTRPGEVRTTILAVDERNQPVANVELWLIQDYPSFPICPTDMTPATKTARTDASGRAVVFFPEVKANVLTKAPGYSQLFIRGAQLTKTDPYRIRLSTGQTITGKVVDEKKTGLANVTITLRPGQPPLDMMPDCIVTTKTDEQGQFEMKHIATGAYQLTTQFSGDAPAVFTQPVRIEVQPKSPPQPLNLLARAGSIVRGKLIGPPGLNLANRQIFVSVRMPDPSSWSVYTDPDGNFSVVGLPPQAKGNIWISPPRGHCMRLEWPQTPAGFKTSFNSVQARIEFEDVQPGIYSGIIAPLVREAQAVGRITDQDGQPVADASVTVNEAYVFQTDREGKYTARIPPMMPVTFKIYKQYELETLTTEPFTVEPADTIEKNITVKRLPPPPPDLELTGRVVDGDGNPAANVAVMLANDTILSERAKNSSSRTDKSKPTWTGGTFWPAQVKTDAEGKFRFNMLKPGKAELWAEDIKRGYAWMRRVDTSSRDLLLRLEPYPKDVSYEGTVLAPDGKGVAGAKLMIFDHKNNSPSLLAEAQSDATGKYVISFVPKARAGFLTLLCLSDNHAAAWLSAPHGARKDIDFQLRPSSKLTGRVVDSKGNGVPGSTVKLYLASDSEYGHLFFTHAIEKVAPATITDAQGNYTLPGVPIGCTASVGARRPDCFPEYRYYHETAWHIKNIAATQKVDDIKLPDGISVEGIVLDPTGAPAARVKVVINTYSNDPTTITDKDGRYRFIGLPQSMFRDSNTVITATSPEPVPQFTGSTNYKNSLYPGDAARGVDITLKKSAAAKLAEWKAIPGEAPKSKYLALILDDADPEYAGKEKFEDTLTARDSSGQTVWQYKGLNTFGGASHHFAVDAERKALYLVSGKRLVKFDTGGNILWGKDDLQLSAIALEPKSGNVWALTSAGTIYGDKLLVFTPDGEKLHEWKIPGYKLAYSPYDQCFWVVSQKVVKVGLDGKILGESSATFAWVATMVAANPLDGSVWVEEGFHPQVRGSSAGTWIINPDATLRKRLKHGGSICIDAARNVAWLSSSDLLKLDLDGNLLGEFAVRGHLALEPDTGCLWVAGRAGIWRVDPHGKHLWGTETAETGKSAAMIPQ